MHRHHHAHRGPFVRRPGFPPVRALRRGRLLSSLLIGGVGYMLGKQQAQNQSRPSTYPQSGMPDSQLAQLKLLGELRESGVLTEAEFQEQKQKILQA
ncbi:MAG TPA: SHOCT domain-containing protein [Ktedonobacteraceae bacterium]